MTFNRSDTTKMGLTALVTAAIFTVYIYTNKPENGNLITLRLNSGPISFDTANMYRRTYIRDSIHRLIIRDSADKNSLKTFQGFVFDTSSIETIIHRNRAGKVPDKVIFYYGEDSPRTTPPAWHIVVYGVKGDTLLQTAPPGLPPTIMDKANPCPPNCPKQ